MDVALEDIYWTDRLYNDGKLAKESRVETPQDGLSQDFTLLTRQLYKM